MLSVRRQRAVLAKPQLCFRLVKVRFVAKIGRDGLSATWCDTSGVVSRDASSGASRYSS